MRVLTLPFFPPFDNVAYQPRQSWRSPFYLTAVRHASLFLVHTIAHFLLTVRVCVQYHSLSDSWSSIPIYLRRKKINVLIGSGYSSSLLVSYSSSLYSRKERWPLNSGRHHVRFRYLYFVFDWLRACGQDIIALLIVGVIFVAAFLYWQHYLEKQLDDPSVPKSKWNPPPLMRLSLWTRAKGRVAVMMTVAFLQWCCFLGWCYWSQVCASCTFVLLVLRAMNCSCTIKITKDLLLFLP